MDDTTEVNLPFERVPQCACDDGKGEPPSRIKRLECKMRGGPCREGDDFPTDTQGDG